MHHLKELTESLLFAKDNYKILADGVNGMHDIYAAHTGIKARDIADADIYLPSGKAISPTQAAHCLLDTSRTVKFLRGIHKAILRLQKDHPGETLNILYAGCGPYATLLTPFTSLFSPDELAIYMMDVSQVSLDSVKKLYSCLGIDRYIKDLILADAATYMLPADKTMHLIVSETMQQALIKEPQVAIMLNLIPQMADKTIFIPEEISVLARLVNMGVEVNDCFIAGNKPERIELGTLYTIGQKNCQMQVPVTLQIPTQTSKFNCLMLFTNITVFEDEQLQNYDCSLTSPLKIADVDGMNGRDLKFTYELGNKPGFKFDWME